MNILFEEDGAFKAGVVLADNTASLQVELPSGKRSKVKAANVLLRFEAPPPAELIECAEAQAGAIDTDFLWEVCPDGEFGFEELATDYVGARPMPVEAAAVLLRLHSAPIYFHRKGRGRFRKAPPEILQAALAGLEKKRQVALTIERMAGELKAGTLPTEFAPLLRELLYKPDRNKPETKALEAACAETAQSVPRLLEKCGGISDTHEYHLGRFLFEYFPQGKGGTGFGEFAPPAGQQEELPEANVRAFSIDDAHTTEIDDAFSLVSLADGGMRVGIHIAAPGLGIAPDSDLGRIARNRLSTVYMPGRKITMLPEDVVERFTLAAGHTVPAVSLYLDVAADLRILASETRLERVPVVANLRHHDIEPLFNEETLADDGPGLPDFPFRDELKRLWELATVLEAGRGAAGKQNRKDYNFVVDWSAATAQGTGRIAIDERQRGSPLDTLVAELMIVANSTWGGLLRDAKVAAIYRAQTAFKTRMTTVAAPHEGLGVDCYAWSSSPLRRHVDLINQWQLIAHLRNETPPYTAKSADLLAALRDFELTYAAYAEFQRDMERYWCLRWLAQEGERTVEAAFIKESLARLDRIPLVVKTMSLPDLPRGTRVRLAVDAIDLLGAEITVRYLESLELPPQAAPDAAIDEAGEAEAAG
ncbi:MAG: RNB domain-containing ribonuclease [Gammaproteobacteria bacterium]|nr:RNB domain-containing ribonuclease [Gammaproteobacteria bacterium]MBU1645172.1 RNB domain-containing ribonuclease [Gammaproteobacteria bacterium]MBU1973409.1 RNB domain-containing ribonuclease [Gammaproteobacteria bacterium]